MQEQIERDLKTALLAGDKIRVEVLKGLKNSLQYEAVNQKIKLDQLKVEQIVAVFQREAKKRREAADLYKKAGESARAEAELSEKAIIDGYLPAQLDEAEVAKVVSEEVSKVENPGMAEMGRIIGAVRGRLQGQADGALIARLVKEALEQ